MQPSFIIMFKRDRIHCGNQLGDLEINIRKMFSFRLLSMFAILGVEICVICYCEMGFDIPFMTLLNEVFFHSVLFFEFNRNFMRTKVSHMLLSKTILCKFFLKCWWLSYKLLSVFVHSFRQVQHQLLTTTVDPFT